MEPKPARYVVAEHVKNAFHAVELNRFDVLLLSFAL